MKKLIRICIAATALAAADVALADGNVSCPAATRAERRPPAELTQMLKKLGWSIRKMQMFNGCYEVYGFDGRGKPVEAYFDPKTLQRVAAQP
jgi:hypothetical protein